jgi:hypothetical protein
MPIEITRPEEGIYINLMSGKLTADDLLTAQQEGLKLAEKYQDKDHVLIAHMQPGTRFPLDIRLAKKMRDQDTNTLAMIYVGMTPALRALARPFQKLLTGIGRLEYTNTLDEALLLARKILAEKRAVTPPPQ